MASALINKEFEVDEYFDVDELDDVRTELAYILLNTTDMDIDTIYALVFQNGSNITWH